MEVIQIIVVLLFVFFVARKILPARGVAQITTSELREQLNDKNIQFIDVRTVGEYSSGHIQGFVNIPLKQIREQADSLSKDKKVVVICQRGMRSIEACRKLKKLGFEGVTNVRGGMVSWN